MHTSHANRTSIPLNEINLRRDRQPDELQQRIIANHIRQINAGGGLVDDGLFVDRAGYLPVTTPHIIPEAKELFEQLSIDPTASPAEQLALAFCYETYFSFPRRANPGTKILGKVVAENGERSVTKPVSITSLFAGLSIDAAIPLIAAGGAIGRLTTSNTKAMQDTLYRRQGNDREQAWQTRGITEFLALRAGINQEFSPVSLSPQGNEFFNMFNLTSKVISLFHCMNAKELHTLANKFLGDVGSNPELCQILDTAVERLAISYPLMLQSPAEYLARADTSSISPDQNWHPASKSDLITAIIADGGEVEDELFVTTPGCAIAQPTLPLLIALENESTADLLGTQMVHFRLSGLAYETVLELVSHSEAFIAHLPDNSLDYMDDTVYRIQGQAPERDWQKTATCRFLELRHALRNEFAPQSLSERGRSLFNSFNLGTRAVQVTFGMRLDHFHKFFIGRLAPTGNESDLQTVCRKMCAKLHELFPQYILAPETYPKIGNEAKYRK